MMDMDQDSRRIAEEAALYVVRRAEETALQRWKRETWLAADPRHARAYEELARMWERTGDVADHADMQALIADDLRAERRGRWFRIGVPLAAVASVAMVLGMYMTGRYIPGDPPVRYVTEFAERRNETLADGTRVALNTESALEVRETRHRREATLERGEAQFDVAHDAARPFVVRVGEGTVTALGTRFQVRREAEAITVTLLEGSVDVAQGAARRVLRPNQQARLSVGAGLQVREVDPELVDGWLEGWLRFRNTPLAQVVAEANRYAPRKLRLGDPALADVELSGNFHTGDSASIAASAALVLALRVDDSGADIVLLPK